MSKQIGKTAKQWLELREQLEQLERAKAQLESELKEFFASTGADSYVIDNTKIAFIEGERPKYDALTLQRIVSPAIFKKVIKTEVDGKKFKSALELGLINEETAEAVTTITPYTQLRVTELAKVADDTKTESKATFSVA